MEKLPQLLAKKQDATLECSHVEHFCETSYLNSLVHFSPVTLPRLWNAEEGEVQRVECGVYSVKSVVWSVECGV